MCSPMPDGDDFGPLTVPDNWTELQSAEEEMGRQVDLWGEQNHPDIYPMCEGIRRLGFEFEADGWKAKNAERAGAGTLSWDGILLEEVYEALSAEDEDKMREELVQVAAVALTWAGAIRRRQNGGTK